ncbi:PaaI family thioesterase [Nocardia jinanensis]|uniref:Acyl-coenzyme A thioesterase THEM4 n=1 Tax=Nocardia jinanensis TaxID=382504 RepID=A0A917VT37_9NOCA|nr:PaaI family thioesterase [Nocardia jinanensis]GGL11937.1 hypothetical protein GCM10011588_27930 [Nocardia jinanensis]
MDETTTPPRTAPGDTDREETAGESLFAEAVADWCRQLAGTLLEETGDRLLDTVRQAAGQLRELIECPGPVADAAPAAPPYRDRKGRLRNQTNPVMSARNPLAPPMVATGSGGAAEFSVVLPIQYQGPPRTLHGGYVSVLLDEAIWNAVRTEVRGISFTRELTVVYERPVPLGVPLTVTGRVTATEGRKTFAEGEIRSGGEICAHAHGLWIAPR